MRHIILCDGCEVMLKILPIEQMKEMTPFMDAKVLRYINEARIESFESFEKFSFLAFDWYHAGQQNQSPYILIYLDREDLFFFCEDVETADRVRALIGQEDGETPPNGMQLYRFFTRLMRDDRQHLEQLEAEITDTENQVLAGSQRVYLDKIIAWRKELLGMKQYYDQLSVIFDELEANENDLLPSSVVRRVAILGSRAYRLSNGVINLREYVAQMREAYQSQLSIQQNELMKVFTVITAVFMPLTLLVGWYGMNFKNMPELRWTYGYPVVIAVSVVLCIGMIWYFRKKKWF